MKLLAPSAVDEFRDRIDWFKKPNVRKLASKHKVEFGFELKGDVENLKEAPPLFWGVHLANNLATNWYYHKENREEIIHEATKVAKLKPDYAVLHGIHLEWHPPKKDYIGRYINHSAATEILKISKANDELIKTLKHYFNLKVENYPLTSCYEEEGKYIPSTFLYTGSGRLNDLLEIKYEPGCDVLLDLEHLATTLNFLNREKNYHNLPVEKIENPTLADRKIYEKYGFYLKKGYIPYADEKYELKDWIKKIGAKYYHLTGSLEDVDPGKKIISHGAIEVGDKMFRKNLGYILAQKPEVLVLETSSSKEDACFSHLRVNETELSFDNLCEILLKEL